MKRVFVITLMLLTFALLAGSIARPRLLYAFILLGPLLLIGVYDLAQRRHTILRNYPIVGHLRYMLEDARHHIRQYLIQGDKEGDPFTRPERAVAYQRAKQASDVQPFAPPVEPGVFGVVDWPTPDDGETRSDRGEPSAAAQPPRINAAATAPYANLTRLTPRIVPALCAKRPTHLAFSLNRIRRRPSSGSRS